MNRHAYILNVLIDIVKLYFRQVAKFTFPRVVYVCVCVCSTVCSVWHECVWSKEFGDLEGGCFVFCILLFCLLVIIIIIIFIESTRSWRPYLHCLVWYLGTQQAHSTCCLTQPEVTRSDYSTISLDPTLGVLCSLQLPQLPNTSHGMLFFGRTTSNFITECRTPGQ